MKFELTPKQSELLKYVENCGGSTPVEYWMLSSTIASLLRRKALTVKVFKNSIKLQITSYGYFFLDFKAEGYYTVLREVSIARHTV